MKLRYTPAAMLDLEQISEYISETLMNPDAAKNLIARIARDCGRLKEQPSLGIALSRKTGREIEGYCLISGKYMVIYDVDEYISVQRVLDTRLDYMRILFETEEPEEQ